MPFFGKSRKRRASDSRPPSSKASTSNSTSYDQHPPPPPYQSPQLSHQHTLPCPYTTHPYLVPQQAYWQATVPYQYGPNPIAASSPYLPLSPPQSPPISQPLPAVQ